MKTKGWYKKVLFENTREVLSIGMTYVITALVLLLWNFALGIKFEWHEISPFSEPSVFIRIFYSAFTFVTLGWLLYTIHFYKVLHDILVKIFGLWSVYSFIKAIVWAFLMAVSYFYVVPWLFDVLNAGTSVLFNIANLVLYLIPPVGISMIVGTIYLFLKKS